MPNDIRKFVNVEVDFLQLVPWWDEADDFALWLRDRMYDAHLFAEGNDLNEDLYEHAVIQQWTLMGVPRPNVVSFDVTVLFEDW